MRDIPEQEQSRSVVHLYKRGKACILTLNGGTLFVDGALALELATKHVRDLGYRKAVVQHLKLDGEYYVEQVRITVTPTKKPKAAKSSREVSHVG